MTLNLYDNVLASWMRWKYGFGCKPPEDVYVPKTLVLPELKSPFVDLRTIDTPVKAQGRCGSCISFGVIATAETSYKLKTKQKKLNIDLSEAHLFFCPDEGIYPGSCKDGWDIPLALAVLKNRGVTAEKYFPYKPNASAKDLKPGWEKQLLKIKGYKRITDAVEAKNWILANGPLATRFSIYTDFNSYKKGIYIHTTGQYVTGHCVAIVGYNDYTKSWICKNSFGPNWGDRGYFHIGYGQCGIDREMWGVEF